MTNGMTMRRRLGFVAVAALMLAGCGDDESSDAIGRAAAPDQADRTVEVRMLAKAFEPDTIAVKKGETVTFKLVNTDDGVLHEFMLGDAGMQDSHEEEMTDMSTDPMDMADEPGSMTVTGGKTEELTWTFTEAGTVIYGCHQPGHYADGMKGTITVS